MIGQFNPSLFTLVNKIFALDQGQTKIQCFAIKRGGLATFVGILGNDQGGAGFVDKNAIGLIHYSEA